MIPTSHPFHFTILYLCSISITKRAQLEEEEEEEEEAKPEGPLNMRLFN
jgi:hypothetical protein